MKTPASLDPKLPWRSHSRAPSLEGPETGRMRAGRSYSSSSICFSGVPNSHENVIHTLSAQEKITLPSASLLDLCSAANNRSFC
jgi:hypothetical protein